MADEEHDNDAAVFRDSFAAALAQALRENDEAWRHQTANHNHNTTSTAAHDTYLLLCHDAPTGWTAAGCRALSQALLSSSCHDYALSHRLVQGIQQAVVKSSSSMSSSSPTTSTNSTTTTAEQQPAAAAQQQQQQELLSSSLLQQPAPQESNEANAALAELAWTVHVEIPQRCLLLLSASHQNKARTVVQDSTTIRAWLGSYRVVETEEPPTTTTTTPSTKDEDKNEEQINRLLESMQQQATLEAPLRQADDDDKNEDSKKNAASSTTNYHHDDDNDEVWAAESDPSDYAYDSGWDYATQLQELETWATTTVIDPRQLSQPPPDNDNNTWPALASTVAHLLQSVQYHPHLLHLSARHWTQNRWLTPLVLTLLVPQQQQQHDSTNPLLAHGPPWPPVGRHLLQVWQAAADAAADNDNHLDNQNELWSAYVALLQQLLQVEPAQPAATGGGAPASWTGLSLLSDLCRKATASSSTSTSSHVQLLQNAVVESSDDVVVLWERRNKKNEKEGALDALLQILLLPPRPHHDDNNEMPSFHAQTLLQTGLFRAWLSEEKSKLRRHGCSLLLLDLCAASPALLGKYAWRFPDLAVNVTTTTSTTTRDLLVLWNLLGTALTGAEVVKWKNTSKNNRVPPAPTAAQCQAAAWSAFSELCRAVHGTLTQTWNDDELKDDDDTTAAFLTAAEEFHRLVDRLTRWPVLARQFGTQMVPPPGSQNPIQTALQPIHDALLQCPSGAIQVGRQDEKKHKFSRQQVAVQGLRRDLKTVRTLLLDSSTPSSSVKSTSSSKAD